ncbi:MAG: hypothetical protein A2103_05385 [Gammaproteobacteria bacterium GWF2_41_13]|nr:MAG: hypothetical protein A2103_05385 [Gammaproteobacteria bacterium GWF2_41_13]
MSDEAVQKKTASSLTLLAMTARKRPTKCETRVCCGRSDSPANIEVKKTILSSNYCFFVFRAERRFFDQKEIQCG